MTYTHDLSVYDSMNREDAIKRLRQTEIKISVYLGLCDHHNKEYDYLNQLQKEMCMKLHCLIKKQLMEERDFSENSIANIDNHNKYEQSNR